MKQKRIRRSVLEENVAAYLYLLPWILGMLVFYIYPFLKSFAMSFTNANLVNSTFNGLENFAKAFRDDRFLKSLKNTLTYALVGVPLRLIFALFLAVLLEKGFTTFRTMFYVPSLIGGSVAVAVMWRQLFGKDGMVNALLAIVGIEGKAWLGEPDFALPVLILLAIWQFGSPMVIFISGLKAIPHNLYEAAALDGATKPRQFFGITLPLLTPIIQFNLILQLVGGLQVFTQGFLITKGGPMDETLFTVHYIYNQAFGSTRMGYASAMSWILFLVIAAIAAVIFWSSKYWVFYEDE